MTWAGSAPSHLDESPVTCFLSSWRSTPYELHPTEGNFIVFGEDILLPRCGLLEQSAGG
jgi:hypothetical protein